MSVHAVQVILNPPNASGVQTAIDALTSTYAETLPEQATEPQDLTFEEDPGGGGASVQATVAVTRVEDSGQSKADVVNEVLSNLPTGGANWAGVWYHSCNHDSDPPSPCPEWTLEDGTNTGSIPSYVGPA